MKTFDEIRDTAIKIVNDLVEQGIIKDCTDTDNEEEFNVQDAIVFRLLESQKNEILNLYTKDKFSVIDNDLIDNLIDYGVIETDEIREHFKSWAEENFLNFSDKDLKDEVYEYFMDFDEHYNNGETHPENWESFMSFYNSVK